MPHHQISDTLVNRAAFTGAYSRQSDDYLDALQNAAFPLIYTQTFLQFAVRNPDGRLIIGNPVTITLGVYGDDERGLGYAYYGLIREIRRGLHHPFTAPTSMITVEIHTVPGQMIGWSEATLLLWSSPPSYIRYVQPHGFLEREYRPRPLNSQRNPVPTIRFPFMKRHIWNARYETFRDGTYEPPAIPVGYYPQHPPRIYRPLAHELWRTSPSETACHKPAPSYRFDLARWIWTSVIATEYYHQIGLLTDSDIVPGITDFINKGVVPESHVTCSLSGT
jgi:hypothetical protein